MTDEFDFSGAQGAEHAQEAMKSGSFEKEIEFLKLDGSPAGAAQGKNQALLRFVTDSVRRRPEEPMSKYNLAWLTIQGHYAPTKPKPPYAREGATWPAKMGGGCRRDPVFKNKYNDTCFVCDQGSKPSKRMWALAVERKEIRNDQGGILGYMDKTREIFDTDEKGDLIVLSQNGDKKEYQMKTVPAWTVLSMGWKNFFQPLAGQAAYYNSLLDGDWLITRTGTDNNDTNYSPIRVAEQHMPEGNPYGFPGGTKYDLALPGLMEKVYPDMPDLRTILAERVSDDYFGRFWVPGWLPEGFEEKSNGGQSQQAPQGGGAGMMMTNTPSPQAPQAPQGEAPSSDALSALRDRVLNKQG